MRDVCDNSKLDSATFRSCISKLVKDTNLNASQFSGGKSVSSEQLSEKAIVGYAQSRGLTAKIISGDWAKLCHRDFPSVVKYSNGLCLLVMQANDHSVLLYDQSEDKTSIISKELFLSRWSGYAMTFQQETYV